MPKINNLSQKKIFNCLNLNLTITINIPQYNLPINFNILHQMHYFMKRIINDIFRIKHSCRLIIVMTIMNRIYFESYQLSFLYTLIVNQISHQFILLLILQYFQFINLKYLTLTIIRLKIRSLSHQITHNHYQFIFRFCIQIAI